MTAPLEGSRRSRVRTGTIANGQTLSGEIDLGRPYVFLTIRVPVVGGAASEILQIQVAMDVSDSFCDLYDTANDSIWSRTLPATGSFQVMCTAGFGAQRLKLKTTTTVSADTDFEVYGIDTLQPNT